MTGPAEAAVALLRHDRDAALRKLTDKLDHVANRAIQRSNAIQALVAAGGDASLYSEIAWWANHSQGLCLDAEDAERACAEVWVLLRALGQIEPLLDDDPSTVVS